MSKTKVHYPLFQITRIGQVADEIYGLRNLFDENEHEIHLLTFPPGEAQGVNRSFFDIATRGLKLEHTTDFERLKVGHSLEKELFKKEGEIFANVHPNDLREMIILKFTKFPPTFKYTLNDQDLERGLRIRAKLSIPADAKIVTLHVRDGNFAPQLKYHDYRNANIQDYLPAIEYLLAQGYHVVRLGDPSMAKFENPPERLIDAPFHPAYEDFFEPYFTSQSKFFIGMPSGPSSVASGFDVPVLYTDTTLNRQLYNSPQHLFLFKKVRDIKTQKILTYREMITSPVINFYTMENYVQNGLEVVNNSSAEILAAVQEMDARVSDSHQSKTGFADDVKHIRSIQQQAHDIAQREKSLFCFYLQKFNIAESFIQMNRELFEL